MTPRFAACSRAPMLRASKLLAPMCLIQMLLAAGAVCAAESKPFTPLLMLQNQDVGEARFSPDGRHVFLDTHLAYRDKVKFDRGRDWGRDVSVLSVLDVGSGKSRVLRTGPKDRTWYLGSAPGGAYTTFGWFDGDVQKVGVIDNATGKERRLSLDGSTSVMPISWISPREFVLVSMDKDEQERTMSFDGYGLRKVVEFSRKTWQGQASVKAVGSGRYRSASQDPLVKLSLVDAASGAAREFDRGSFGYMLTPAPQGGRLAYLRKLGSLDMSGVKTKAILSVGDRSQLVIIDSAKGKIDLPLCEGCSVDDGSLRWSPSGQQLYYSVRSRKQDELAHAHYTYEVAKGVSTPLRTPGLEWDTEEEQARYVAPLLWLDDEHLAVRTRREGAGEFEDQGFRWTRINRAGAVQGELTAQIPRGEDKQVFKYPVATYQGGLLFIASRQLWQVPAQGAPRSLTAKLGADVESWCAPYAPWRMATPRCDALGSDSIFPAVDALALERNKLALRIMREGVFSGEFAFVDLASGEISRVKRPSDDSMPLEVSALAGAALFQRKGSDGDEVLLVRAGQAPLSVHRFNAHLANVGAATPVLLTRREAGEDEDRNDWLLLPPNHKPGDRHPLLVYFYPDTRYRKELKGDDLRDISFLNKNIPAARGYAVLLASMKISDYGTAGGNPMREMHEQLIRAAENAVAKGYVDPDRWAIMGHSYGGYGTNSIITQTGRFKAAVSLAGLANLTSGYGIGMNTDKTSAVPEGLNFGALWSEGGQGRMGVPPWQDPQRYINNSPLFQADKITTPLMLIHGDLDFVNVNEAEQLFAALHRQGKDVQLVRYWGEGHVYLSPGNIEDMWTRIFAFLDESGLQGPAKATAGATAQAAP